MNRTNILAAVIHNAITVAVTIATVVIGLHGLPGAFVAGAYFWREAAQERADEIAAIVRNGGQAPSAHFGFIMATRLVVQGGTKALTQGALPVLLCAISAALAIWYRSALS
jgi:hypothetical protein